MKVKTQPGNYIYPLPIVIVGADDAAASPNFMVAAYIAPLNHEPPIISVSTGRRHYTNECIELSKVLSINVPSRSMIEAVDYAGSVSGADTDKSLLFRVERGDLGAPMVASCPISMECRLVEVREYLHDKAYICEVVDSYVDEAVMTAGLPDITKVDPLCLSMHDFRYFALGECLGKVWSFAPGFTPHEGGV